MRLHRCDEARCARTHNNEVSFFGSHRRRILVGREILPLPLERLGAAEGNLHRREVVAAEAVRLRLDMPGMASRALDRADVARMRIGCLFRVSKLFKPAVAAHALLVDFFFRVAHFHAVDMAGRAVKALLHVCARKLGIEVLLCRLS